MSRLFPPLLVALCLASASARAECPTIQPRVEHIAPFSGASGVPQNGVIAFGTAPAFAGYDPNVALTITGGAAVPGALIAGPSESWIFRPDDDLLATQSYTATITDALGTGAPRTIVFTTGTGGDATDPLLPVAPTLTLGEYVAPVRTDDCQLPGYWSVLVDWDDAVDSGPVLYALVVDIVDLVDPGFAPAFPVAITSTGSQRALAIPELSEATVSVFAIDQAGRQAHTPNAKMETPEAPIGGGGSGSCSCDLDPESQSQAAWLGILVGIGLLVVSQRALHRLLR